MRLLALVAAVMLALPAIADVGTVLVEANQTVVQVNGVVCSFCAYGAEKTLSRLDGLDKAEFGDGVLIDIDTHRITLALRPGEKIPFREIVERIKKAGYDPITLHLRSEGVLKRTGEKLLLRDARSGQVFSIVGAELPAQLSKMLEMADETKLALQGHVQASEIAELRGSDVVEVTFDRLIPDSDGVREDG